MNDLNRMALLALPSCSHMLPGASLLLGASLISVVAVLLTSLWSRENFSSSGSGGAQLPNLAAEPHLSSPNVKQAPVKWLPKWIHWHTNLKYSWICIGALLRGTGKAGHSAGRRKAACGGGDTAGSCSCLGRDGRAGRGGGGCSGVGDHDDGGENHVAVAGSLSDGRPHHHQADASSNDPTHGGGTIEGGGGCSSLDSSGGDPGAGISQISRGSVADAVLSSTCSPRSPSTGDPPSSSSCSYTFSGCVCACDGEVVAEELMAAAWLEEPPQRGCGGAPTDGSEQPPAPTSQPLQLAPSNKTTAQTQPRLPILQPHPPLPSPQSQPPPPPPPPPPQSRSQLPLAEAAVARFPLTVDPERVLGCQLPTWPPSEQVASAAPDKAPVTPPASPPRVVRLAQEPEPDLDLELEPDLEQELGASEDERVQGPQERPSGPVQQQTRLPSAFQVLQPAQPPPSFSVPQPPPAPSCLLHCSSPEAVVQHCPVAEQQQQQLLRRRRQPHMAQQVVPRDDNGHPQQEQQQQQRYMPYHGSTDDITCHVDLQTGPFPAAAAWGPLWGIGGCTSGRAAVGCAGPDARGSLGAEAAGGGGAGGCESTMLPLEPHWPQVALADTSGCRAAVAAAAAAAVATAVDHSGSLTAPAAAVALASAGGWVTVPPVTVPGALVPQGPAGPTYLRTKYVRRTRLLRTAVKIQGVEAEQVAAGWRDRVARVVANAGLQLEAAYVRSGCCELVVDALLWEDPAAPPPHPAPPATAQAPTADALSLTGPYSDGALPFQAAGSYTHAALTAAASPPPPQPLAALTTAQHVMLGLTSSGLVTPNLRTASRACTEYGSDVDSAEQTLSTATLASCIGASGGGGVPGCVAAAAAPAAFEPVMVVEEGVPRRGLAAMMASAGAATATATATIAATAAGCAASGVEAFLSVGSRQAPPPAATSRAVREEDAGGEGDAGGDAAQDGSGAGRGAGRSYRGGGGGGRCSCCYSDASGRGSGSSGSSRPSVDIGALIRALQLPEEGSIEYELSYAVGDEEGEVAGGLRVETGGSGWLYGGGTSSVSGGNSGAGGTFGVAAGVLGAANGGGATEQQLLPSMYSAGVPTHDYESDGDDAEDLYRLDNHVRVHPGFGACAIVSVRPRVLLMPPSPPPATAAMTPGGAQPPVTGAAAGGAAGFAPPRLVVDIWSLGGGGGGGSSSNATQQPEVIVRCQGVCLQLSVTLTGGNSDAGSGPTAAAAAAGAAAAGGGGGARAATRDAMTVPDVNGPQQPLQRAAATTVAAAAAAAAIGSTFYTAEVALQELPSLPGLLLVEARQGRQVRGAVVPVLLLDDPWVAAELGSLAERWQGTPGELRDVLMDVGCFAHHVSAALRASQVAPAPPAAPSTSAAANGLPSASAAATAAASPHGHNRSPGTAGGMGGLPSCSAASAAASTSTSASLPSTSFSTSTSVSQPSTFPSTSRSSHPTASTPYPLTSLLRSRLMDLGHHLLAWFLQSTSTSTAAAASFGPAAGGGWEHPGLRLAALEWPHTVSWLQFALLAISTAPTELERWAEGPGTAAGAGRPPGPVPGPRVGAAAGVERSAVLRPAGRVAAAGVVGQVVGAAVGLGTTADLREVPGRGAAGTRPPELRAPDEAAGSAATGGRGAAGDYLQALPEAGGSAAAAAAAAATAAATAGSAVSEPLQAVGRHCGSDSGGGGGGATEPSDKPQPPLRRRLPLPLPAALPLPVPLPWLRSSLSRRFRTGWSRWQRASGSHVGGVGRAVEAGTGATELAQGAAGKAKAAGGAADAATLASVEAKAVKEDDERQYRELVREYSASQMHKLYLLILTFYAAICLRSWTEQASPVQPDPFQLSSAPTHDLPTHAFPPSPLSPLFSSASASAATTSSWLLTLSADLAPSLLAVLPALATGLAWPLLPRRAWSSLVAACMLPRLLAHLAACVLVAALRRPPSRAVAGYHLGPAVLVGDGLLFLGTAMVPMPTAALIGALRVPVYVAMWYGMGAEFSLPYAWARAVLVSGLAVATNAICHAFLRAVHRGRQRHAAAATAAATAASAVAGVAAGMATEGEAAPRLEAVEMKAPAASSSSQIGKAY